MVKRNLLHKSFTCLCFAAFALLFVEHLQPIPPRVWLPLLAFMIIAVFFELRVILLPSGEDLSLISPILLAAGVTYGIFPILLIVCFVTVVMLLREPKKWFSLIFNGVQYGMSAWIGLLAYKLAEGVVGGLDLQNVASYCFYIVAYLCSNCFFVCSYLYLRDRISAMDLVKTLFDRKSMLIYVTMMAVGVLMSTIIRTGGYFGVFVLAFVLWGLGASYRHYYKMYDHFRSLSVKDELTGLYNHRYFQETLQRLIEEGEPLSLLLLDLDYFKKYNDLFGHPAGDKLLGTLSAMLRQQMEQGIVCRYGGEEFAVILPQTEPLKALQVAESFRASVAAYPFPGQEHMPQQKVTVSIGVASYPAQAQSKKELIDLADQALYKVKYTSRNRVQLYTSVIDELRTSFSFGANETEVVGMIKTFLTVIHSKDQYTYGHTERLMEYAERLARKLGLAEEEIKIIRYGALLHDIGKVEVPTEILNRQERLGEEEREIVQMHVAWGEQIIRSIPELVPCLDLVSYHHERYDGKGYPYGLAGQEIPLSARILAIADSFDAMTHKRPGFLPKTFHQAIEELRKNKGTQFDPQLIEPFVEVLREVKSSHLEMAFDEQAWGIAK